MDIRPTTLSNQQLHDLGKCWQHANIFYTSAATALNGLTGLVKMLHSWKTYVHCPCETGVC